MEVIAIESGDTAGWIEAATTLGEVEFNSIKSFVDNVIGFLKGNTIHKLHLQAHGDSTSIEFGADELNVDNFKEMYRGQLSRLTPFFSWHRLIGGDTTPIVVLRACEIGQNTTLLANLAGAWNVKVISGRGYQNNLYNMNTGRYVTMNPDGSSDTSIILPPNADYESGGAAVRIGHKIMNNF
jgi:hypothetical protein